MEKKIIKALITYGRKRGLSLEELHKKTGISRGPISKHVAILEGKGEVIVEKVGNLKLVSFP